MKYISTRGGDEAFSSKEAILQGIARDGGLYLPIEIPSLSPRIFKNYRELAIEILEKIFDDFSREELQYCIDNAYDDKFSVKDIVQGIPMDQNLILELFHGKTSAFKDFALSILPYFMELATQDKKEEIAILTATSGDTGKAALEGFKDIDQTKIIVFYPTEGVSEIQKYQMMTQEGSNTYAIGIHGNFDEAQSALKQVFNDKELLQSLQQKNIGLSSANSINIGRLIPQMIYYYYGYSEMVKQGIIQLGDRVNIAVPTGNFGNILAAFLAKLMGLPVKDFICVSNRNNVLTDFFKTGIYDRRRDFYKTNSPSMDILISSNLERFLYIKTNNNGNLVKQWMEELQEKGHYQIDNRTRENMKDFKGYTLNDEETIEIIQKYYDERGYLCDTHTAVCLGAVEKYEKDEGKWPTIIASTASPYKFPKAVGSALDLTGDDFQLLDQIYRKTKVPIPTPLQGLQDKTITQNLRIEKTEIKKCINKILGV
ncbi:MAG: threonine synthase [Tissierellia bacterium]|nr:threonine synthase [Tissierellia bacterium]